VPGSLVGDDQSCPEPGEHPVRATDIATELPLVDRSTPALDAIRLIADADLLGIVVEGERGGPWLLVSSVDVARLALPEYIRNDLSLANVMGEIGVDDLRDQVGRQTVGDLIDDGAVDPREVLVVGADAHLVEVLARMVDARTQVALLSSTGDDPGPRFVTLPAVFDALVVAWGHTA
jgi:CBS domain-containing protein